MSMVALKEWAVVCEALRQGRQSILLRKGGIHEGPRGFQPDHERFLLYPTRFHQAAGDIVASAHDLLQHVEQSCPPQGRLRISLLAEVAQVFHLHHADQLAALTGMHILSDEMLKQRFEYRAAGLFVLVVKVFMLPEILELEEFPHYAGCHSWVQIEDVENCQVEQARPIAPVCDAQAILNERLGS